MARGEIKGLKEFEARLQDQLDRRKIARKFITVAGKHVIDSVIASAKLGIGPNDAPYPPWSESYLKQLQAVDEGDAGQYSRVLARKFWQTGKGGMQRAKKAAAAGMKQFLYLTGKMLDLKNFSWRVWQTGTLALEWRAPDTRTGIYAEVHNNGLPIGRGGPIKKRTFMHFTSSMTKRTVLMGFKMAIGQMAADFNSGKVP